MPELDDRIRAGLDRLAAQASPGDPFESVVARKRHRRWVRRADRAFLAVVVLAAVGGGSFALVQAFGFNQTKRPLAAPVRNGDIAFIRYEPRGGTTLDAMSPDGSDVRVIARLPDNFLSPG